MTLEEFLGLIEDEEARIEVEINDGVSECEYLNFWISDYRSNLGIVKYFKQCDVKCICFSTIEDKSNIAIRVKF